MATASIRDADTHVAKPDVLGSNFLVQTSGEDGATLEDTGEDVGRRETLGQVDGGHTVSLVLRLVGELTQAQLGNGGLDAVRNLGVGGKALRKWPGGDLGEGGVESVDELGSGRRKVRGLEVLVVLHDGDPVGHGGVVGRGRGLAGLEAANGTGGGHDDAETRWAADGLLTGSENDVNVPGVKGNLLRANTADTVHNDQGVGADTTDNLGHALDVAEDTGGGVDVGDGDDLVGLLLQGLLDLLKRRTVTDGSLELGGLGAIGLQTRSKRVRKVTGVQHQSFLIPLNQVRSHHVPSESTAACDDEGLRGGVAGLEKLADEGQGLSEGLDEAGASVALPGNCQWLSLLHIGRGKWAGWKVLRCWLYSRIVGHRLKHGIVELNRTRDQKGRVRSLSRHVGW